MQNRIVEVMMSDKTIIVKRWNGAKNRYTYTPARADMMFKHLNFHGYHVEFSVFYQD